MLRRPVVTALVLVAAASAFTLATPPSTSKFRVVETNHQVVDLSGLGGPEQTSHIVTSSYVTLQTTDSARGKAVRVTVDSIKVDTMMAEGVDPSIYDSLRGAWATGWVSPEGVLTELTADSVRGGAAKSPLRLLFPKVPPRAKVGDHWTDTTSINGQGGGLLANAVIRRVTNWVVNNGAATAGAGARKVDAAFSQSVTGELQAQGGAIAYDGTGTGSVTYFLAPDGRQLGTNATLSMTLSLTVPQAPEPIPVTGTVSHVLTPIR